MVKNSLRSIEARHAIQILESNIDKIRYVKEWANLLGYSKGKLNNLTDLEFGISAKNLMKEIRLRRIKQIILEHPEYGSYAVAIESGLSNERELYKFLNRNYNTCFSKLKYNLYIDNY